jgi:hypothetical protein
VHCSAAFKAIKSKPPPRTTTTLPRLIAEHLERALRPCPVGQCRGKKKQKWKTLKRAAHGAAIELRSLD